MIVQGNRWYGRISMASSKHICVGLIWYQLFPVRLLQTLVFWTGFSSVITKWGFCRLYLLPGIKHLLWELSDLDCMQTYFCNKDLESLQYVVFSPDCNISNKECTSWRRKKGSDQDWSKKNPPQFRDSHSSRSPSGPLWSVNYFPKNPRCSYRYPITWGCLWRSSRVEEGLGRLGCAIKYIVSLPIYTFKCRKEAKMFGSIEEFLSILINIEGWQV